MEQPNNNQVDDFFDRITIPREKMELPALEDEPEDELTDNDEENESLLDYSSEHKDTAMFFIGMIDSGMGILGMMLSGQNPERYQKFAKAAPPDYYVDATAAMVKKYQAKMSLESMFFTALIMIYAPVIPKALEDRKKAMSAKEKEAREQAELAKKEMITELAKNLRNG